MRDQCSQCSRPIPPKRTSCFYCGGSPVKVEVPQQEMRCPRCSSAMRAVEDSGVTLDHCDQCGGTWYDLGELEALRERTAKAPADAAAEGTTQADLAPETENAGAPYLPCPRCAGLMVRQNYLRVSGVLVDVCGRHGLFLDAGERERIDQFHAAGGDAKAQNRGAADASQRSGRKDADRRYIKELGRYAARRGWFGRMSW